MEERILALLKQPEDTPLNPGEMMKRLGLDASQRSRFERSLRRLEQTGQVARIKKGNRYALPLEADLVPGRIRVNRQGVGLLQPTQPGVPAIRVPPDAMATAMNGDRVLVRRDARPVPRRHGRDGEVTGRIVRVLEKKRSQLVGTLQRGRSFLYVIPDDPRITQDIYVPEPRDVGRPARPGDKVVVELKEWENRHVNPEGEVIEVLGPPDAEGVDMLSVLRNYNLPLHFPKKVLQEARAYGTEIHPHEISGRTDCRDDEVVTIDPEDAKDFDDAICLRRVGGDRWRLWVHIADVSHYVKPGTALDEEAARRGNSTYLVDRVIPMLPEALSNELCSLKPHVERLTKCVEFLLAEDGRVLESKFYPAVIRSQRRFNYQEAFQILQRAPADSLERMLHDANEMAQKIRRARFKGGSLALDFPETKIFLDASGAVDRIEKVENDISHQLIEEYMLLANEAVAGRLMSSGRQSVYRIHEPPEPKRLEEYREELLIHRIPCGNLMNRHEVQKVLAHLDRLPIGQALKIGFLKSLMRARYSTEPVGHYGLNKKKYTHFTSPIRRYADLLVHRALFQPEMRPMSGHMQEIADHISETERNSDDAERDSRDVKLFAHLRRQLESGAPETYQALVTDLRNFGFFVDVTDLGMSGLVHLSSMSDDFFVLDPERGHLVGRRTRKVIRMGDKVQVRVAKVDTFKRQVDFELALPKVSRGRAGRELRPPAGARPRPEHSARQRRTAEPARPPAGKRRRSGSHSGRQYR